MQGKRMLQQPRSTCPFGETRDSGIGRGLFHPLSTGESRSGPAMDVKFVDPPRWPRRIAGVDPVEKNATFPRVGIRGRPTDIFLSHFALLK
jgi:hypothetical protein